MRHLAPHSFWASAGAGAVFAALLLGLGTAPSMSNLPAPSEGIRTVEVAAPGPLASFLIAGTGELKALDQASREDAAVAAESTGRDLAQVEHSMAMAQQVNPVMTDIALQYPSLFVDRGPTQGEEPGDRYVVFTERPSSEILDSIAALAGDTLVYYGAPVSEAQLTGLQVATGGAMLGEGNGQLHLRVSIDRLGLGVTVTYGSRDLTPAAEERAKALALATAAGTDGQLPVPVSFHREDSLSGLAYQAQVKGGYTISGSDGSVYKNCTSGFTGRNNATDNLGVTSARHCSDGSPLYQSASGVLIFGKNANTIVHNGETALIDLQFWKTTAAHDTTKKFRSTSSQERTTGGAGDPADNDLVCHYGIGSGSSCGDVVDPTSCLDNDSGQLVCKLVTVDNADCEGQDSGGPWFDGTVAQGIHAGHGDGFCYFTRISASETNMNVHILRS